MSDIPNEIGEDYYNKPYFAVPKGKHFRKANGELGEWSYANPYGEFLGAKEIAAAWKTMFNPTTMLDVGAGRGTFIAYARDYGIEAYGFDYSKWAVSDEGRYARCQKNWLIYHDATKPWPYPDKSADVVVALDFMEHMYSIPRKNEWENECLSDLDKVLPEFYRVAKRWIFLEIAISNPTSMIGEVIAPTDGAWDGYALTPGEPIPQDLEGCVVAGHVTVKPADWWYDKLNGEDFLVRRDMARWFVDLVPAPIIHNWTQNLILVLERI